ncbi:hypothetical protein GQ600_7782 [Phytophthora cactorum]|nr:hypothetical protein GQ600_7782 [Phytophthora cactorum]
MTLEYYYYYYYYLHISHMDIELLSNNYFPRTLNEQGQPLFANFDCMALVRVVVSLVRVSRIRWSRHLSQLRPLKATALVWRVEGDFGGVRLRLRAIARSAWVKDVERVVKRRRTGQVPR